MFTRVRPTARASPATSIPAPGSANGSPPLRGRSGAPDPGRLDGAVVVGVVETGGACDGAVVVGAVVDAGDWEGGGIEVLAG